MKQEAPTSISRSSSQLEILLGVAVDNEISIKKDVLEGIFRNVCNYASKIGKETKEMKEMKEIISTVLTKVRKLRDGDGYLKLLLSCLTGKPGINFEPDGNVLVGGVKRNEINSFEQAMNNCYVEVVEGEIITKNDKIEAEKAEDDKETTNNKIKLSDLKRLNADSKRSNGPGQEEEDKKEEKNNSGRGNDNNN